MMFVATLSEHLVCNRLFFTLAQPIGIFICGSVLFIFVHQYSGKRCIGIEAMAMRYMRWKMSFILVLVCLSNALCVPLCEVCSALFLSFYLFMYVWMDGMQRVRAYASVLCISM